MHYYKFHIADFALHTTHLTLEEEGVFRRLLDHYYDTERPIPKETKPVIRRLRLVPFEELVQSILEEFFVLQDDGWHNLRADEEIIAYYAKGDTARENGKKGGRPKKNKSLRNKNPEKTNPVISGLENKTQVKANHKPITKNQEPREGGSDEPDAGKPASSRAGAVSLDYSSWPEMASQQVLTDWFAMRKRLKANVSQTVINQFGKELWLAYSSGYTVDDCLGECITSNWKGFKFSWLKNREAQHAGNQLTARPTRSQQNEQAHRDYIAELERRIELEEAEAAGGHVAGVIEPPPSDRSH